MGEFSEVELKKAASRFVNRGIEEWGAVFDSVSDLILVTSIKGVITRYNRRVAEYFGLQYDDIMGENIIDLFYGEENPLDNIFKVRDDLHSFFEDVSFPRINGWFAVSSYPINSVYEDMHGMVHILKDVTVRKRVEEEKRVSDRELLTLYAVAFRLNSDRDTREILNDVLFQIHNMLRVDFSCIHLINNGFLELTASLGFSSEQEPSLRRFLGCTPWVNEILSGQSVKAKTLETKELPFDVMQAASAIGIQAWCAVPLKISSEVVGILMVAHKEESSFTDREVFLLTSIASQLAVLIENQMLYARMKDKTTELQKSRKALKENLYEVKQANIELDRLNTAKNSFIGMASHELKTPITSILCGVEFLMKFSGLELNKEQQGIFSSVYEGVLQLKDLVEDLLSISRIEAKGITLQKREINLIALSRDVYDGFALPLSKRLIKVHIMGEEGSVMVDEGFCRLVIRNLIENAIKFTPDGGELIVLGRIEKQDLLLSEAETIKKFYPSFPKCLNQAAKFYRLDVCDNGIGIPTDERIRIFEKFYGVGDIAYHSSGKTDFMSKGSGLGLSIVKGVMDAHNGLVWVTDGHGGNGSNFTLLFPLDTVDNSSGQLVEDAQADSAQSSFVS